MPLRRFRRQHGVFEFRGPPLFVDQRDAQGPAGFAVDDADGRRAFHTCRQMDGCPSDNSDYVYGTNGSAYINGWTPNNIETKNLDGQRTWNFKGRPEDMYQTEHNELWASIREGNPINDAERGCNCNLMAIMGRMPAYTGQVVTWDQAMNSEENLTPDRYGIDVAPPPPTVAIPGQTKFV